jgi:hypothetical protein
MESAMPDDDSAELKVITDPVFILKRAFGQELSAQKIAEALIRDLIVLEAFPFHVDYVDGWWLISSAKDWLLQSDGSVSFRNFERIVHFPEAGREACHNEVLLTAYTKAAITKGTDGEVKWIVGEKDEWILPPPVLQNILANSGRTVAFRLSDG